MQDIAKLNETQSFSEPNSIIVNGGITKSGGILLNEGYFAAFNVELASDNASNAAIGQSAGIYVQHLINNTVAGRANVNSGIRVQIETYQQRAAAFVNDAVGGYFGIRNNGVDVGGFGIHVDAYHNGTGVNSTMYGMSSEMYREQGTGFTAAFHARSIGQLVYWDNDYGYLASPGGTGTKKFNKIFSGGSAHTGNMLCDVGLDLAFATCGTAAIRIGEGQAFLWDGVPGNILQQYDPTGEWQHWVTGIKQFGLENTGRIFIVNNANTVYAAAGAASGNFLAIRVGGLVYKLNLLNF